MNNQLTVPDICFIHDECIDLNPASAGIRSWGVLYMSAKPGQNETPQEAAARILKYIVHYQAFNDGNHRTGLMAAWVLLRMNGYKWNFNEDTIQQDLTNIKDGTISDITSFVTNIKRKKPRQFTEAISKFKSKYELVLWEMG